MLCVRQGHLIGNIQTLSQRVREKIQGAKSLVLKTVDETFKNMQEVVLEQLSIIHNDNSLYSIQKSQKHERILADHLQQIQAMQKSLKTERGLSNLIYFFKDKQEEIGIFHSQLSAYLQSNENYSPKVEINHQALYSLQSVISRIIKIGPPQNGSAKKQPLQHFQQNKSVSPIKYKIQDKSEIVTVQSQVAAFSPQRSRLAISRTKQKVNNDALECKSKVWRNNLIYEKQKKFQPKSNKVK